MSSNRSDFRVAENDEIGDIVRVKARYTNLWLRWLALALWLGEVPLALLHGAENSMPRYGLERFLAQPTKGNVATKAALAVVVAATTNEVTNVVATASKPLTAWDYWMAQNALVQSVTNRALPADVNDCEFCKNLPRPRKCCGYCGRVNDCQFCLSGEHELPGGKKRPPPGRALSEYNAIIQARSSSAPTVAVTAEDLKNTCPACSKLAKPRNCCGLCGRPNECQHCALFEHLPGGAAIPPELMARKGTARRQALDNDESYVPSVERKKAPAPQP